MVIDKTSEKPNPIVEAYRKVARTPEGKTVLADILNETALMVNGFTGNSTTFFNLGRREIGLHVLRRLAGKNTVPQAAVDEFINFLINEGV